MSNNKTKTTVSLRTQWATRSGAVCHMVGESQVERRSQWRRSHVGNLTVHCSTQNIRD